MFLDFLVYVLFILFFLYALAVNSTVCITSH